jgi:hypothetical protein
MFNSSSQFSYFFVEAFCFQRNSDRLGFLMILAGWAVGIEARLNCSGLLFKLSALRASKDTLIEVL